MDFPGTGDLPRSDQTCSGYSWVSGRTEYVLAEEKSRLAVEPGEQHIGSHIHLDLWMIPIVG